MNSVSRPIIYFLLPEWVPATQPPPKIGATRTWAVELRGGWPIPCVPPYPIPHAEHWQTVRVGPILAKWFSPRQDPPEAFGPETLTLMLTNPRLMERPTVTGIVREVIAWPTPAPTAPRGGSGFIVGIEVILARGAPLLRNNRGRRRGVGSVISISGTIGQFRALAPGLVVGGELDVPVTVNLRKRGLSFAALTSTPEARRLGGVVTDMFASTDRDLAHLVPRRIWKVPKGHDGDTMTVHIRIPTRIGLNPLDSLGGWQAMTPLQPADASR